MAQRRMLNTNMINSDEFSKLSQAAQLLYIHLNMTADDDGMVGNPEKLMRSLLIRKQNLDTLVEKGYIIRFDSGVVAIRHWHQHNYIRSDRYVKTRYITELSQLKLDADSTYYILDFTEETGIFGQPNDVGSQAQCSVGKVSIGKDSIGKCSVDKESDDRQETTQKVTYTERTENNEAEESFDFERVEDANDNIRNFAEYSVLDIIEGSKKYTSTLSALQKQRYEDFLINLNIYVTKSYIKIDVVDFIRYNEDRCWRGPGGESVIKNYKRYIDAWVKRDFNLNRKSC